MVKLSRLALAAAGVGAVLYAARRVVSMPPDPKVSARAEAASYSGPWTHGYKVVNSVKLHYVEIGDPGWPLVLLLHGFPECWYEWHNIMPRLAGQYHVVALDMRGYNWSERPRGVKNYSMEKLTGDVSALIGALGHETAHLVGHDWGGNVAWYTAATHADKIDKLVVINAPHPEAFKREIMKPEQLIKSYYVFLFQLPLLPEAIMRLTLRNSLQGSAEVPGAFSDDALDMYQNAISHRGAATAMINYYRASFRQVLRLRQVETKITRPTLLIWGMKDFALSSRLTEGLERWVPDLRINRIEECGHWVPEEKPRLVADKLLEFFSAEE
ncbi:MAG: alpha/beta fold hydrolase [Chloroflexota bacterium]